ncbi:MAG: hypothetical protein WA687_07520 [Solirubrobacterales bacterium]
MAYPLANLLAQAQQRRVLSDDTLILVGPVDGRRQVREDAAQIAGDDKGPAVKRRKERVIHGFLAV